MPHAQLHTRTFIHLYREAAVCAQLSRPLLQDSRRCDNERATPDLPPVVRCSSCAIVAFNIITSWRLCMSA